MEWHEVDFHPKGFSVTNPSYPLKGIVNFNKGHGTAGQKIKEGNYVLNRARWSRLKFVANQMRLLLFIFAYNLANFVRRLGFPESNKT